MLGMGRGRGWMGRGDVIQGRERERERGRIERVEQGINIKKRKTERSEYQWLEWWRWASLKQKIVPPKSSPLLV